MRAGAFFLLSATLLLASALHAGAERRVALIVGNAAYEYAPALRNPRNDAEDVAAALERNGFEVILGVDLIQTDMQETMIRFSREARSADVALFYYAGHAMQFEGVNYLMPVDVSLDDEADLRRLIRTDDVVKDLQQARNLRILVLDACRDNPLAANLSRSLGGGTRGAVSLAPGLARIDSREGMIIAFSTQPGQTAADGVGRNSPFSAAFLRRIQEREEIGTIFRRVTTDVHEATSGKQWPEVSFSVLGEFYLGGLPDSLGEPEASGNVRDPAAVAWDSIRDTKDSGVLDEFLKEFPTGFFASLAQKRLTESSPGCSASTISTRTRPPRTGPRRWARRWRWSRWLREQAWP